MTEHDDPAQRRLDATALLHEHGDRVRDLAAVANVPVDEAVEAILDAVPLTPDENGVVMFPPEVQASIARMDAARARLRELHAPHVDLGQCSHGWVAGVRLQRGRAHREVIAHGAPSPAQALEQLAIEIENLPPIRRHRRNKKGRR